MQGREAAPRRHWGRASLGGWGGRPSSERAGAGRRRLVGNEAPRRAGRSRDWEERGLAAGNSLRRPEGGTRSRCDGLAAATNWEVGRGIVSVAREG